MKTVLVVFLSGQRVGVVTRDTAVRFAYDEEYLNTPAPTPLSLSMPLRAEPQSQRATIAWIQGLLPANDQVRARLAAHTGVRVTDIVGMLERIGLDCPGAVQAVAPGNTDQVLNRESQEEPVDSKWIAGRLAALAADESDWRIEDGHWSLGGGQGKFPLRRGSDGSWAIPLGAAASTHIIKPGIVGVRLLAANEHVCLRALSDCGVPTTPTTYETYEDRSAVVVTRFDRVQSPDGSVSRRHTEDLCQALGFVRAYERQGGPHARDILALLGAHADLPSQHRFVEALMANYLLGAPDAHARNYSLLLDGSQVALAPLYDIASALPYEISNDSGVFTTRRVAMAIAGETRFGLITPHHWVKFLTNNRIDPDWGLERLADLATQLPDALSDQLAVLAIPELTRRLLEPVARQCHHVQLALRA